MVASSNRNDILMSRTPRSERRWSFARRQKCKTALLACACLSTCLFLFPFSSLDTWRQQQQEGMDEESSQRLFLNRPAGTPVILNIGSNVNPIVPRLEDSACTVALAFEPVVPEQIVPHPALHVVPAAVTGHQSAQLAVMHLYHPKNAVSSSLAKPSHAAAWNRNNPDHSNIKVVPTLSFGAVLEALQDYRIDFVLTDMQGFDFQAVSSVTPHGLRQANIPRLQTEVYTHNTVTYESVHNDLCRDWWPFMLQAGYVLDGLLQMDGTVVTTTGYRTHTEVADTCSKQKDVASVPGLSEMDALWRRSDVDPGPDPVADYRHPRHSPTLPGPQFPPDEYAACTKSTQEDHHHG